jgi:uncharacterized protein YgiM (DUF1202 family)
MTAIATVTAEHLNVRGVPHSEGEIVGSLKKDGKVVVLERKAFGAHVWLKIRMPNKSEGWVYSKYVTVSSNVPDEEPPHIPIPDTSLAKLFAWVVGIIAACSALAYCVR